jgi:hypothetical protein
LLLDLTNIPPFVPLPRLLFVALTTLPPPLPPPLPPLSGVWDGLGADPLLFLKKLPPPPPPPVLLTLSPVALPEEALMTLGDNGEEVASLDEGGDTDMGSKGFRCGLDDVFRLSELKELRRVGLTFGGPIGTGLDTDLLPWWLSLRVLFGLLELELRAVA